MGRHTAEGAVSSGRVALVAVAVVVVAGLTWGIARAVGSDDTPNTAARTSSTSTSSSTSSSSSTTSASPSPTTPDPAVADAKARGALEACQAEVAGLTAITKAGAASARDWAIHTEAQLKFDRGDLTLAQTQAAWAKSKARGASDTAAFKKAQQAAKASAGGCRPAVADTEGTKHADAAKACVARAEALKDLVAAGASVNGQWAAHVEMMANKAHSDASDYHARWLSMVRGARPALAAHREAAEKVADAPACS